MASRRADLHSVCVFCGSSNGADAAFIEAARDLGKVLAKRGLRLVYGGSGQGLMGMLANSALEHDGEVVGVMPDHLVGREMAHQYLSELHVVDNMAQRKAMMAQLADAFVALPGGYGTLDELSEMLTGRQLDLHVKPVAVLNVNAYYDALLAFLDHAVTVGFIRATSRSRLLVADTVDGLMDTLISLT